MCLMTSIIPKLEAVNKLKESSTIALIDTHDAHHSMLNRMMAIQMDGIGWCSNGDTFAHAIIKFDEPNSNHS